MYLKKIFIFIPCLFLLFSCAHFQKKGMDEAKRKETIKYKDKVVKLEITLRDLYAQRETFEKFLNLQDLSLTKDDWLILKTKYKFLYDTIELYENLSLLLKKTTETKKQRALDNLLDYLLKTDITNLVSLSEKLLKTTETVLTKDLKKEFESDEGDLKALAKDFTAIRERYNDRKYDDVVSVYENSLAKVNKELIANDINLIYASSLIRIGNVNFGTEKLEEETQKQKFDSMILKIKLANLYYAMGDYDKTKEMYNSIINTKITYEEHISKLRNKLKIQFGGENIGGTSEILSKLTKAELIIEGKSNFHEAEKISKSIINKYPNTPYSKKAKELLKIIKNYSAQDIELKLSKIRAHTENGEYQLAYDIIFNLYEAYENNWPNKIYLDTLRNLEEELNAKRESRDKLTFDNIYSINLKIYEEASSIIETSKDETLLYDAVKKLKSLFSTEFKINAENKIKEAEESIIKVKRRKAGSLFLKAKRQKDPETKKSLLMQSYNILEKAIEEFPDSNLRNTLEENLLKVAEAIKKIEQ